MIILIILMKYNDNILMIIIMCNENINILMYNNENNVWK